MDPASPRETLEIRNRPADLRLRILVFFFTKSSLQQRHCQERQRQPTGVAVDIEERESPVNARCSDRSEFHTEADL